MKYTYKKITWVNDSTPLNADNLNRMEAGISDALMNTQSLAETAKYHGDEIQTLKKTLGDDFYNEDGTRKEDTPSVSERFDDNETDIEDIKKAIGEDYFKDSNNDDKSDNLNNDNTITKRLTKIGKIVKENLYNNDGQISGKSLHQQVQDLKDGNKKLIKEIYNIANPKDEDESRIDKLEKTIGIGDHETEEGETPLKDRMDSAESDITQLQREVWGEDENGNPISIESESRIDVLEEIVGKKDYDSENSLNNRVEEIEGLTGLKPLSLTQQFTTTKVEGSNKHILENTEIPNIYTRNQKIFLKGINYNFDGHYEYQSNNAPKLAQVMPLAGGNTGNLISSFIVDNMKYSNGEMVNYSYSSFDRLSNFPITTKGYDSVVIYTFEGDVHLKVRNGLEDNPLCLLITDIHYNVFAIPLSGISIKPNPILYITKDTNYVTIEEELLNNTYESVFGNTYDNNRKIIIEIPEDCTVKSLVYPIKTYLDPGGDYFTSDKTYQPVSEDWDVQERVFIDTNNSVVIKINQDNAVSGSIPLYELELSETNFYKEHQIELINIPYESVPIKLYMECTNGNNIDATIELNYLSDSSATEMFKHLFLDKEEILLRDSNDDIIGVNPNIKNCDYLVMSFTNIPTLSTFSIVLNNKIHNMSLKSTQFYSCPILVSTIHFSIGEFLCINYNESTSNICINKYSIDGNSNNQISISDFTNLKIYGFKYGT